jgi:hypothetical protein
MNDSCGCRSILVRRYQDLHHRLLGICLLAFYKVIFHALHLTIGTLREATPRSGRRRCALTGLILKCSNSERSQPPVCLGMYTLRAFLPRYAPCFSLWERSWRFSSSSPQSCRYVLPSTQGSFSFSHCDTLHTVFSVRRCRGR